MCFFSWFWRRHLLDYIPTTLLQYWYRGRKYCDITLCIMVWSKIIMHAILGPYCPARLSASWTSTLIWVQSVQGLPGSLALCCLSNTGSLCFTAAQWTLQGPHRHKGMFGWIRYTATHCLFPYVWLHNSDLTSKLGQGGSCSTQRLDGGEGGRQRRGKAGRANSADKIVRSSEWKHLGDISVKTLTVCMQQDLYGDSN